MILPRRQSVHEHDGGRREDYVKVTSGDLPRSMPSVVIRLIGLDAPFWPDSKSLLVLSSNGAMCRFGDHDSAWNVTTRALPTPLRP